MKLSEVKKGSVVVIAGRQWEVLGDVDGGLLCLHHKLIGDMLFNSVSSDSPDVWANENNDWKRSSLRKWLNENFLEKIMSKLGDDVPVEHCTDLRTEDGMTDYGTSTDKVSLLSTDQYRRYRKFISPVKDWWWLLTATSTVDRYVRCVFENGTLSYGDPTLSVNGIRPTCVFAPSTEVEVLEICAE